MLVDSHLHVWRAWPGAAANLAGVKPPVGPEVDVPVEDAAQLFAQHGVERGVLVQPIYPGEDNSYVVACARAEPERFAAVCVVDPRKADAAGRLADWVEQGCRGLRLRPKVADEGESFGDPATFALWQAAERLDVVVSVLSDPQHNAAIGELAERFARVPIVVDHLGHPDVAAGVGAPGFQSLLALARRPNVWIKLSGFYHFSREAFPYRDCWPFIRAVYDAFGPGRLLWGSDYPHVTVRGGYRAAIDVLDEALSAWAETERRQVLGENALGLYWPRGVQSGP
jgi:predicted TIM-barrel fold metal-dependent hydrolase